MASIRETRGRDGTTWQVRWREHGLQTSATFADPKWADTFRLYLEAEGPEEAYAWLDRQTDACAAEPTFRSLDDWVDNYITHLTSVTEGTRAEYAKLWRRTFAPLLGDMPLDAVSRDRVSAAVIGLAERLSHKSIRNATGLASAAMNMAVEDHDQPVKTNPFRNIRLPAAGNLDDDEDEEMMCLTHAEFDQLHQEVPPFWRPYLLTLVGTGMRSGEARALRVGDLNLDQGTARIRRAWKKVPGGWEIGPPKTKAGRRTVIVPPEVAEVLRPTVAGRRRDQLVFHARRYPDTQIHPNNFRSRVWVPAIGRARRCQEHRDSPQPCGCPGTLGRSPRLHDLRHTMAAWWIGEGTQLPVIQRQLGHESILTTMGVYGDLLPDVLVDAARAASAAMGKLSLPG